MRHPLTKTLLLAAWLVTSVGSPAGGPEPALRAGGPDPLTHGDLDVPDAGLPLPQWIRSPRRSLHGKVGFGRSFQLDRENTSARLWVACDESCRVWLNGMPLTLDGPQEPSSISMARVDLDQQILTGANSLCVETRHREGKGALLLILEWGPEERPAARLVSDPNWKAFADPPRGWWQAGSTPSWWGAAQSLGIVGEEPRGQIENGPHDLFRGPHGWLGSAPLLPESVEASPGQGRVFFASTLAQSQGSPAQVEVPSRQLPEPPRPPAGDFDFYHLRKQIENEACNAWLASAAPDMPFLTLDFGTEINGRVVVELAPHGEALIAVRAAESAAELEHYKQAFCEIHRVPADRPMWTGVTGFRYARVWFLRSNPARIALAKLQAEFISHPVHYEGSFESSDPLLDQIWRHAAYTARLCLQDESWDGIKRDRMAWAGDALIVNGTAYSAFGETAVARATLEALYRRSKGRHINGIPMYSHLWVTAILDYVMHSGDMAFLESQRGNLVRLLDYCRRDIDQKGLFADTRGAFEFVDWSPLSEGDKQRAQHATLTRMLRDAAPLFQLLGEPDRARRCEREAQGLGLAARRSWWSESRRGFDYAVQPRALAITARILPAQRAGRIALSLARHPGNPVTPFQNEFVLDALAQTGQHPMALEVLREYWGKMLELGATTFWEVFDPSWEESDWHARATTYLSYSGYRISLCHGWASGPARWLQAEVLGIKPLAPGFSKVEIRPHLADLQWAGGTYPTPRGTIRVRHERSGEGLVTNVVIPDGIETQVVLPKRPGAVTTVRIDGTPAHSFIDTGDSLILRLPQGGSHTISVD